MAASSAEQRNDALARIKAALVANSEKIFSQRRGPRSCREERHRPAIVKRLRFDDHKLADVCAGIDGLIDLPDPVGRVLLRRELDEGLTLVRQSCPIGVIGVIFEARPDALVHLVALHQQSGNCAILKGGSETLQPTRPSSRSSMRRPSTPAFPEGCLYQVEAREDIALLLDCFGLVDLLIPRRSNSFVRYIMDNTKIPVMGHADGICHIYVDEDADVEKSVGVVVDAKVQYTAACNAVETLLVHRGIARTFLPAPARALGAEGVTIRGTEEVQAIVPC